MAHSVIDFSPEIRVTRESMNASFFSNILSAETQHVYRRHYHTYVRVIWYRPRRGDCFKTGVFGDDGVIYVKYVLRDFYDLVKTTF